MTKPKTNDFAKGVLEAVLGIHSLLPPQVGQSDLLFQARLLGHISDFLDDFLASAGRLPDPRPSGSFSPDDFSD